MALQLLYQFGPFTIAAFTFENILFKYKELHISKEKINAEVILHL